MSFIQDLQAVLEVACDMFGYIHGEAMVPCEDGSSLVQSGASVCKTVGASDFKVASASFCMPPNVCIPGRVWRTRTPEWHKDVSAFSPAVFLRVEIARLVGIKGCACIPLISLESNKVLAVVTLFAAHATKVSDIQKQPLLDCINRTLFDGHVPTEIATFRADPLPMGAPESAGWRGRGADGEDVGDIVGGGEEEAKSWQSCRQVLCLHHSDRDKEATGTILKFSKRLPLFKYITNTQRTALCSTMELLSFSKGVITHKLEEPEDGVWLVVVTGSLSLMVRTSPGGEFVRMACFGVGETFGHSYLKIFCTMEHEMTGYIECDVDGTECVRVTVPPQFRNDFRTCSRPLWYDEMAKCFHVSVDQAAEQLGICMSVIKKICRRHGITRWPHRKLQSANKSLVTLKAKIAKCGAADIAQRNALVSEAVTVLTSKLRLTANPAFLLHPGNKAPKGSKQGAQHPSQQRGPGASMDELSVSSEGDDEGVDAASKKRKRSGGAAQSPKKGGSFEVDAHRAPSSSSSASSVSETSGLGLKGKAGCKNQSGGARRAGAKGGGKPPSVEAVKVEGAAGDGRSCAVRPKVPQAVAGRASRHEPAATSSNPSTFGNDEGYQHTEHEGLASASSAPYGMQGIHAVRSATMGAVGGLDSGDWVQDGIANVSLKLAENSGSFPATPSLYHLTPSTAASPGFSFLPSPDFSPACHPHNGAPSPGVAGFWL